VGIYVHCSTVKEENYTISRWIIYFFYFLLSLDPGLLVCGQAHLTVKKIVRRNIQMTGVETRLKHIENNIFKKNS